MTTPSTFDVPMATAAQTKSSSPTAGPVQRGGSVEPFEPYGSRPTKSAPKSSTSKEAPALQDPEVSSGATARDLKSIPEGSTAPAHSSGAGSHGTQLHAPRPGPNPLQGRARTSEPEDRNQLQRTEGGSFLQVFVCRGESAVGDILDCVIESLDNIAVAAPSWDPSGAFFAEMPVDHFEAYFRKWDPASPSLLIASTQAHRLIEASTERKLRFQQEHMEVDDEALLLYACPTKASAAKGSGPKAKKTLDSICVAPGCASRRERGGAVSNAMTSADEGGAASEAEEIMTPGARKSYSDATKAKGKDKAPAKSPFEGMHPSVALSYCQRQAAAAKKAAASFSTLTTAPPAAAGETSLGNRPRADSTHNTERPDTPSTAALPAKKLRTADDWFKSLLVEMINNFALGLQVLGPTAVDFSIDQILATGQQMGSFGFPIEVASQSVPPTPAPANPPANASAGQGASALVAQDKGKGKIVVPGTHPTSDNKPDARANLTTVVITFDQSADERSVRKEEEVRAIVARLYHSWQLAEHEKKGGTTSTLQPKLNPVIRVKWDEKRQNQLQLAFQVCPELNFVNWLEDVWKNMTTCPSKGLSIQDIFEEVSRHNPEVFQHMVPSNYTPVAFWGAGHKKGSPGPLHIFVYDVGGEVAQRIVQEKVTIGSKKCSLVLAQSVALPKDTRPRFSKTLPTTEPQLKRSLPPSFLDALAAKRTSGQPHRWSDKDLVNVAKYVSKKPPVKGITLTVPSYEENRQLRASARAYGERAAEERARTLAEQQTHKPTLAERLAKLPPPTPAPAAPKPVLIDFKKLSPVDLIGIFKPKLTAVHTRLQALTELQELLNCADPDHRRALLHLVNKVNRFLNRLDELAPVTADREWQLLDWGCKAIGKVSFKQLRKNYSKVLAQLNVVNNDSYFEWI
ncbi:hypothetical protein BC835DRAFT_1424673 [Cytidiella melzeri]|nr:hypothetical protein BC835DRAFT_1424673 [Cytidiella melzeri]